MTASPTTPIFRLVGELSREAIAALASLLIAHARAELEEQRGNGQEHDDHSVSENRECQV